MGPMLAPWTLLPAYDTATAHTFALEFDLVMDFVATFGNKQAEVSTGDETYDTQYIKLGKMLHDQSIKWIYDSMWNIQLDECHLHDIFGHYLNKDKQLSASTMRWLWKP